MKVNTVIIAILVNSSQAFPKDHHKKRAQARRREVTETLQEFPSVTTTEITFATGTNEIDEPTQMILEECDLESRDLFQSISESIQSAAAEVAGSFIDNVKTEAVDLIETAIGSIETSLSDVEIPSGEAFASILEKLIAENSGIDKIVHEFLILIRENAGDPTAIESLIDALPTEFVEYYETVGRAIESIVYDMETPTKDELLSTLQEFQTEAINIYEAFDDYVETLVSSDSLPTDADSFIDSIPTEILNDVMDLYNDVEDFVESLVEEIVGANESNVEMSLQTVTESESAVEVTTSTTYEYYHKRMRHKVLTHSSF
jgi:hypothetical protein